MNYQWQSLAEQYDQILICLLANWIPEYTVIPLFIQIHTLLDFELALHTDIYNTCVMRQKFRVTLLSTPDELFPFAHDYMTYQSRAALGSRMAWHRIWLHNNFRFQRIVKGSAYLAVWWFDRRVLNSVSLLSGNSTRLATSEEIW